MNQQTDVKDYISIKSCYLNKQKKIASKIILVVKCTWLVKKKEKKKCSPDNLCSLLSYYKSLIDVKCDISAFMQHQLKGQLYDLYDNDVEHKGRYFDKIFSVFVYTVKDNEVQCCLVTNVLQNIFLCSNRFGITSKLVNNNRIFLSG